MTRITFDDLRERLRRREPQRIRDPAAAEAAVALILVPTTGGEDLETLFIRRAAAPGDPWSGQMALPGGRRDHRDSDLLATAVRETEEETGIVLAAGAALGELDDFAPRTRSLPRAVVRPYVFGLGDRPPLRLSEEVAYHVWVPVQRLLRSYGSAEVVIGGRATQVEAFVIGSHVIWGLTERIISPFIELYNSF